MGSEVNRRGRKQIWLPLDLHEVVMNYCMKYNEATGQSLKMPEALVMILDEWDIMKDAQSRSNTA